MNKPGSLRSAIAAALPDLQQNPDRLLVFVDDGVVMANAAPGRSFEYIYNLQLILTDFAGHPDEIMVPLLSWVAANQVDLLANPDRRRLITFKADLLSHDLVDLEIRLPLTECVVVQPRDGGGYTADHMPEPAPEDYYPGGAWRLYANNEHVANWNSADPPSDVPPPLSGSMVVVLANVPAATSRTLQFARDAESVLWRYTDEPAWRVLYPLSEVDGEPVELQVGQTHLQWRRADESTWRDLISIQDLATRIGVENWTTNTW